MTTYDKTTCNWLSIPSMRYYNIIMFLMLYLRHVDNSSYIYSIVPLSPIPPSFSLPQNHALRSENVCFCAYVYNDYYSPFNKIETLLLRWIWNKLEEERQALYNLISVGF